MDIKNISTEVLVTNYHRLTAKVTAAQPGEEGMTMVYDALKFVVKELTARGEHPWKGAN